MIDKEGLQKHRDKIFNDILEMLETNQRVGCVQPTGIGKSYCIARLCNKLKGKKLVLEPGNEVINYMQKFNIETPDTNYITYYSLLKPSATDLANMFKEYNYIFLDEMHRALADKWGKQLDKTFAILDVLEAKYKILGFSATPTRMDNRDAVEEIFNGVQIEPYYLQDAILDGILPNIEYHSSIYEITDKDKEKIELKDTPLAKQILSYDIDEGVSKIFQENLDLSQPHHIIVFVDRIINIPEAIDNMKKWLKVDFSIYKAHSKMSYKESKEAIENFQKDKGLSLMFAVDILNEGVHLDKVDTSVFLRKTSSTRVYNQQLGRVVSDTVENPKVFDLVNNIDNLDTGYAFMFKEKADKLNIKTEQLVTKNGEHLKITTHQEDLVKKLKMCNRKLSDGEKQFIKDNYKNMTNKELAIYLNRSEGTIVKFKSNSGITCPRKLLSEREKQFIKDNCNYMSITEMSKILNRDRNVLYAYISKEGLNYLRLKQHTKISEEKIQYIKDNSYKMTAKRLSENTDINIDTIIKILNRYNLKYLKKSNIFTDEEEMQLKNYIESGLKSKDIAIKMDRDRGVILQHAYIKGYTWPGKRRVLYEWKEFIDKNAYNMTVNEMCKHTGIKESTLRSYYSKNNISYKKLNSGAGKKEKKLSKQQKQWIKNNSYNNTCRTMSDILETPIMTIYNYCKRHNLPFIRERFSKYQ